jgi:hypothetical protein
VPPTSGARAAGSPRPGLRYSSAVGVVAPQRTKIAVELGTDSRPVLIRWSSQTPAGAFHDAFALRGGAGPVLVDPEETTPEAGARLEALLGRLGGPPAATVLTSSMHERAAYRVRARHGTPVWMPAPLSQLREGEPDHFFEVGAALPGGLRAVEVDATRMSNLLLLWPAPMAPPWRRPSKGSGSCSGRTGA